MSFYGSTDTPVSDLWWRLLWVSRNIGQVPLIPLFRMMTSPLGFKPEWTGICDVHSLSMAIMAAGRCFPPAVHYRWINFSTDTPSHYFNPFHDLGTLFMGGGAFSLFITRMTIQEVYYWWLLSVTLVVAFDFFTKIFQRWWDLWMLFCHSVTVGWVVRILKPYLL